jgi:hypothetical protein
MPGDISDLTMCTRLHTRLHECLPCNERGQLYTSLCVHMTIQTSDDAQQGISQSLKQGQYASAG